MRAATICVIVLLVGFVSCKRRDGKRKSDTEKYKTVPNVCDNDNPDSPIMCHCDLSDLDAAKEATCWVVPFGNDTSFPWSHFQSQTNLKKLKISVRSRNYPLTDFPTEVIQNNRKLEMLEIHHGVFHDIKAYALSNASYLREALLSSSGISVLHPHAFCYLTSIVTISLENNNIVELETFVFHHVPNLQKLLLSRNNISIVHDNAFRFTNHLHELDLHSNAISIITRETFNGLFRLQRLDLTNNRLKMIGDLTFAEMSDLQELLLDNNALEFVSDRAFTGLPKLNYLRMSGNKLKSLGEDIFKDPASILFLDLRDNAMEALKFNTLKPLWENFKNSSAQLFLEGNHFPCDCDLSWTYSLRNETMNKNVLTVLDELTCISDEDLMDRHEPLSNSEQQDDQFAVNSVVEYDDSDDIEYEELPEEDGPPRIKILEIAPEKLPCPESLAAPTDEPKNAELPSRAANRNYGNQLTASFVLCVAKTAYLIFLT